MFRLREYFIIVVNFIFCFFFSGVSSVLSAEYRDFSTYVRIYIYIGIFICNRTWTEANWLGEQQKSGTYRPVPFRVLTTLNALVIY